MEDYEVKGGRRRFPASREADMIRHTRRAAYTGSGGKSTPKKAG